MRPPSRSSRSRLLAAAPAIAYAALIFALSSVPGSEVPSTGIPNGDKLLHVVEYFVYGLLLLFPTRALGWRGRAFSLAVGIAYAAFDEWHQSFVPGRSADALDVAADVVGLLLAVAVGAAVWRSRTTAKPGESATSGGKV